LALALVGLVVRAAAHDVGVQAMWQFVGLLGITAAAGAVTTAVRSRQEATRDRAERVATEERLRMAQDLHDGVGHGLAVIAMQAGVGLHVLDRDPAKARQSLEAIRATSTEALEALRAELAQMSGGPAIRRPARGYADVDAVVERVRAAGLSVEVRGDPGTLGDEAGRVVHAVVQESLTNVLRHAAARRAVVEFEPADGAVVLTVSDDGRGGSAVGGSGMGIDGMRARVEGLGGSFQAGPGASDFRVRAEIPT
jgi:signal transduction histidine kinase